MPSGRARGASVARFAPQLCQRRRWRWAGPPIIGKLLGHASPTTTSKYAHLDNDPVRRATNAIGATIAAAIDRKPAGENVVELKARRDA
jgi:hypothetical protein